MTFVVITAIIVIFIGGLVFYFWREKIKDDEEFRRFDETIDRIIEAYESSCERECREIQKAEKLRRIKARARRFSKRRR